MAEEGVAGGWKWLESVPEPGAFSPEPCRNRHGTVPEPVTFLPEPPFDPLKTYVFLAFGRLMESDQVTLL